ncbi:hypothetical protein Fot_50882 [Forsythia ovata]|uniref:Uncharacterized protein n=1 Tax=Forsythia ovata TaxID=205694 RepID=A0ABD1PZH4_9LAMI
MATDSISETALQIRGYQNLNCVDSEATSSLGSLLCKMVPNRGNRGSFSQGQILQSSFQFMPTPGVSLPSTYNIITNGPVVSTPTHVATRVITQEVNILSIVKELQKLDVQEMVSEKVAKA